MCMSCRSLFVPFYFFFWPLCCLFFDTRYLQSILISNAVRLVMCDSRELVLILFLIIQLYFFPPPMHFTSNASNAMKLKESCRYCTYAHSSLIFFQCSRCYQGNQSNMKTQTCCSLGNHWTSCGIVAARIFWYAILFSELVNKTQKFWSCTIIVNLFGLCHNACTL